MDPSQLHTPDERIAYISRLMANGDWLASTRWCDTLASKWGVAVSTVKGYASIASRYLKIDVDELNYLRRVAANKFLAIAEDALSERSLITGLKDYGSAIKAIERYCKYIGIDSVLEQPVQMPTQTVRVILTDGHQTESTAIDGQTSDK